MIENSEVEFLLENKYYEYHYLESMHYLHERNDDTQTIVVGSSYGLDGIFCELMYKSYNFSMHSQDLWYDGLHVQRALKNHSNIKNCVFCIGYYSFFYDLSQTKNNYKVVYTYDPLFNNTHHLLVSENVREMVKSELEQLSLRDFYHDFFENTPNFYNILYDKSNVEPVLFSRNGGWANSPKEDRVNWALYRVSRHNKQKKYMATFKENVMYMEKLFQLLTLSGVNIYVIVAPFSEEYLEVIDKEYKEIIYDVLQRSNYPVNYYDLNELATFNREDFLDSDHVNSLGGTKMTNIINEILSDSN